MQQNFPGREENRESKESNDPVKRKFESDDDGNKLEHQSRNDIFDCFNKMTSKADVVGRDDTKPNLGGGQVEDDKLTQRHRRKHKFVTTNFKFKQKLKVTGEEVNTLKRHFGLF